MNFSVYIIQDRTKKNPALFKSLAGDTKLKNVLKDDLAATGNDLIGANIFDRYATTEILGNNAIAIRGEMISSVEINSSYTRKETLREGTTSPTELTSTKITVTGSLYAPSLLELKSKTVKNKNMARVLAWASLPPTKAADNDAALYSGDVNLGTDEGQLKPSIQQSYGNDYSKYYYRRVLITIYSNTDTQFRAILYDDVFVSSYEESYSDKDGNGTFTLVMKTVLKSVFDAIIAGPTFTWNALTMADQISSEAKNVIKKSTKILKTGDEVSGTHNYEKTEHIWEKSDGILKTFDTAHDDDALTLDKIADNTVDQKDNFTTDPVQKDIDTASKYTKAYNALTADQKAALGNIPGFSKMSIDEKLRYVKKIADKND